MTLCSVKLAVTEQNLPQNADLVHDLHLKQTNIPKSSCSHLRIKIIDLGLVSLSSHYKGGTHLFCSSQTS